MEDGLLSLKWNNHRSTFFHILTSLREKGSYTDATLACEGEFFPVHKLIMSTCSDYFADMFDRTQCKSPIVVLKDIKKSDLSALLDYMYVGEVDVRQSDLAGLIKAAECLRIKGLAVPDEDPMKAAKKQVNVSGPRVPERSRSNSSPPPPSKRQKRESSNGPSSPPPIPPSTSDNRSTSVPSHVNSLPVIKGGFGEPPSPTRSDSAEVLPLDHIKVEHDDGGQNNSPSTQLDHRGDTSNELGDMGGGMGDSIGDSMSDFPQFNEQDIEKQEHDQLDYSDQLAGPSGLQSGAQSMGWNEGDDASFPHNLFGTDDPNQQQVIRTETFYGSKSEEDESLRMKWVAPVQSTGSDLEIDDIDFKIHDDDLDPDFIFKEISSDEDTIGDDTILYSPKPKRNKKGNVCIPESMSADDDDDQISTNKNRMWNKEDINPDPLPPYVHKTPDFILSPYDYFTKFFSDDLKEHIVNQSNLYSKQKDVNSKFKIDKDELNIFLGLIIYMGVISLPNIDDYWGVETRIHQVADYMSAKRFKLIWSLIHFNNNQDAADSTDRFIKIRPVFDSITNKFLKVPATPINSIDEVMVACKDTKAGNLRQCIMNMPDKWGYKLFCRGSVDGFIHDIIMYQGESTFSSHPTKLSEEENNFPVTNKIVICLVKTMNNPASSAVYADNYFTSISVAEYLMTNYGCRYTGTARDTRIGAPPLVSVKDMGKKFYPRGSMDYASSEGILALRWKDNKIVTVLSTDCGVKPDSTVSRYDHGLKKKQDVPCPDVIKKYNDRMGGIEKSDKLTYLYKTPMRAKGYYMKLFGYAIDLCICNAWVLYKRDCESLKQKPIALKKFRLDISSNMMQNKLCASSTRASLERTEVHLPKKGQKTCIPSTASRSKGSSHLPYHVSMRQTCKNCSKSRSKNVHRSRWMCDTCEVALCLSDSRNCFKDFHS